MIAFPAAIMNNAWLRCMISLRGLAIEPATHGRHRAFVRHREIQRLRLPRETLKRAGA